MDREALKRGRAFEREFAERTGARLTPGSGNQWFATLDLEGAVVLWSLKDVSRFPNVPYLLDQARKEVTNPGGRGGDMIPALALRFQGRTIGVMDIDDMVRLLTERITIFRQSKAEARMERAATVELFREDEHE